MKKIGIPAAAGLAAVLAVVVYKKKHPKHGGT